MLSNRLFPSDTDFDSFFYLMDPLENTSIILMLILCAKLHYSNLRKRKVIEKLRVVLVCFFVVCLSMVLNGCKGSESATTPTGLTAAAASSSQINLSWTASTGATSYNVYEATIFEGPYTEIGSTTNTSFTATGLTNGTTYIFEVRVVNSAGYETGGSMIIATPQAPHTYPVGSEPYGIAIDDSGNVWVTNQGSNNVTELSSTGTVLETFTVSTNPTGIAIDGSGNMWVVSSTNNNVTEFSSSGVLKGTYAVGSKPYGIAIDDSGNVWVANWGDNTVTEFVGIASRVETP